MLKNSESLCHVCGSESNGMYHYGAQVCRACAAFFRRALTSPYPKKCRMNQKCDFLTKNGYFKCKFCRLKKCYDVGMSSENFQLNRDVHNTACRIPETVGTFLGRSNLIIFSKSSSCDSVKSVINLENLIEKAMRIMKQSPESPIFVRNSLEKLAFSLGPILKTNQNINSSNYGKIYGMDQSMAQIEHEILTVTKWLTHFDGFLDLAPKLQIQIFQACWNLWWKLERLATTAMEIRRNENLRKMKRNSLLYKFDKTRIDVSWLTRYSLEELKL
ncbi:Protein CBG22857 [Caenorhabditis briggsae]|uniref:Protein CBG22857 n=1 Tax=Caenorhabditis briggsae TaxID=6238 RepID=A8Y381_CAEBR|nr:Protein CBG22857 [Caenorhabditis briggsae]CAP39350.2 Protein CBG22857 [Caenorhabditis briggsae]